MYPCRLLLENSSVTVAPKYQDAFGYITALRTFTGRHSPEVICPDFFGLVDHDLKEAADHQLTGHCALCNVSSEDDPQARAYSVTYQMLAQYSAADRARVLKDLRAVSMPELNPKDIGQLDLHNQQEETLNILAKGSALFTLLDVKSAGKLSRMELWAGLLDYGYTVEEICLILDIAVPSSPSAKSLDITACTEQSDFEAPEEERPYTQEFFDTEGDEDEDQGHVATEEDTRNASVRSPGGTESDAEEKLSTQLSREISSLERKRPPEIQSYATDLGQKSFESKQSTVLHVPDAKDLPASVRKELVTVDAFVHGLEVAVAAMSQERRSRFARNVDMLGHADQAGQVTIVPTSPTDDAFGSVLKSNDEEDGAEMPEADEKATFQGRIQVNVEFARDAIDRSRARQLAKKLPKSLENLRNVLPYSHVKRIISIDEMSADFGANYVWCCKRCAKKFNSTANEVFEWSDHRKEHTNAVKIQHKLDNLRHLKAETVSMPEHSYPVGELPALCTPRMYRALHDHTSRSYVVGPPQFTPGGVKDLISESARIRGKTDFRKLRLPQLDKLPMDRPDTVLH
jgi:hypothetical protein